MHRPIGFMLGTALLAACLAPPAPAQTPTPVRPDMARVAAGQGTQVFNRTVTAGEESGRVVARLDARAGDGGAIIEGVQLGEGVIEVDLRGRDAAQQSFLGIAFHVVDWTAYEAIYFGPFNFRAATEEQRTHAVQYIAHPANTWQKLRAERPGQFEKALDPPPDPNAWFHARIVLANGKVEVFVNGAKAPSLVVDDLGEARSGGIALWAGNGSGGAYANLAITPTAPPGPPPVSRQTIFQAASTGNLARLRALIEADAGQANARLPGGGTPLHMAAAGGHRAAVEYLLSKGADLNADTRHSGTPIDTAFEVGRPEIVRLLESKGGRFTPIRFDVTTITPAIHRIAFPWGMMNNVLVFSGGDGAVIVDSGFTTRALDEMKKVIARFSPAGVRYVVNSHGHGDHVAGNAIAPGPAGGHHRRIAGRPAPRPRDHAARRAAQGAHGADTSGRLQLARRRRGPRPDPAARPALRRRSDRLVPEGIGREHGRPAALREHPRRHRSTRLPVVPRGRPRRVSREHDVCERPRPRPRCRRRAGVSRRHRGDDRNRAGQPRRRADGRADGGRRRAEGLQGEVLAARLSERRSR